MKQQTTNISSRGHGFKMWIQSVNKTVISGVTIYPGLRDYELNHKDPVVAMQLRIMRDETRVISFQELLEGDRIKGLLAKHSNAELIEYNSKLDLGLPIASPAKGNNWVESIDKTKLTDELAVKAIFSIKEGPKNAGRYDKKPRKGKRKRTTNSGSGELS